MTAEHEHHSPGISMRQIGSVWPAEHAHADVSLVTFHEDRKHPFVSLFIHDHETGEEASIELLDPADALLLANRISRAANLALEGHEEAPELEDELARIVAQQPGGES